MRVRRGTGALLPVALGVLLVPLPGPPGAGVGTPGPGALAAQAPAAFTVHPADDRHPVWNPDGLRLAYESNREGSWDIQVAFSDGSDAYAATDDPAEDRHPAWSPEGERLVFQSDRSGSPELWILDLRTDSVRLVAEIEGRELHPWWSPDGTRIVFALEREDGTDLWTVGPDGSDPRRLLEVEGRATGPRWSPDGERLSFFTPGESEGGGGTLHLLELATGEDRPLDTGEVVTSFATWSGDGRRIAAATVTDEGRSIRVFDLDGRPTLRFARGFHAAADPHWSSDGEQILFAGQVEEGDDWDVYLLVLGR